MVTVYYWIIVVLLHTPANLGPNEVPMFRDHAFYATDKDCQKQMDRVEILVKNPKVREVIFHKCFKIDYPTKSETDV